MGKHKIQDHWDKTIYHVKGQPYEGMPGFRIIPVAGEGKVKIVHQNLLLPFGGNIEGDSENERSQQDVSGPQDCILAVSDDGFQSLKLCQQILNPMVRMMQSLYCVHKLCKNWIIGLKNMGMGKISILAWM